MWGMRWGRDEGGGDFLKGGIGEIMQKKGIYSCCLYYQTR